MQDDMNGMQAMNEAKARDALARNSGGARERSRMERERPPMFFRGERPERVGVAILVALLLASCGGGGGGSDPTYTVTGQIVGLQPGSTMELALTSTGARRSITAPVGANAAAAATYSVSFDGLAPGTPFDLTVTRQPLNQLCAVRDGEGSVTASLTVRLDCHATRLNDTGLITSSAATNEDADAGRDAERVALSKTGNGRAGFDFTRLCVDGSVCPPDRTVGIVNATDWACTRDNVTGLVWVIGSTTDQVLPPDLCGAGIIWRDDAGSNKGFVPSVRELLSIADLEPFTDPTENFYIIDRDYFPTVGAGFVKLWSSEANAAGLADPGDPSARLFAVDFTRSASVLVEGCTAACGDLPRLFVGYLPDAVLDDALVLAHDASTGIHADAGRELQWYFVSESVATHDGLLAQLQTLNATTRPGGFQDWRIPNVKELDTLLERRYCGNATQDNAGKCSSLAGSVLTRQAYWSNSSAPFSGFVWSADFGDGQLKPLSMTGGAGESTGAVFVRNPTWQPETP